MFDMKAGLKGYVLSASVRDMASSARCRHLRCSSGGIESALSSVWGAGLCAEAHSRGGGSQSRGQPSVCGSGVGAGPGRLLSWHLPSTLPALPSPLLCVELCVEKYGSKTTPVYESVPFLALTDIDCS